MSTYIRFVVDQHDEDSHERLGVFQAASELRDRIDLPESQRLAIKRILGWFSDNLPRPERFARSRRPNAAPKAISWFKNSAVQCLEKIRELNFILNTNGYMTERVMTDRPGYIVYEDEFQIVAEPFRGERN